MAYPTVSAPYGLKPVNLIGGQVYAGSTRLIPIASGYATNIFYGDVVKLANTGTIQKDTGTTTVASNGVAGIFVGCVYTNPSTKQPTWAQYWPASTVASDAQAYVVDDPDVLFKVAAVSSGTTVAFYGQTVIGNNVSLVQNSGSTTTGDSAVAIDGSAAAATASLPIRIVAGVPDTANASGEFCEFICKFNAPYITLTEGTPNVVAWNGGHMYNNPTGV
jgi:uncharacterized protein (UPF0333 family)